MDLVVVTFLAVMLGGLVVAGILLELKNIEFEKKARAKSWEGWSIDDGNY